MTPLSFIQSLTGKVFKIMPMRESEERGENLFLAKYVDSVLVEMSGAMRRYPFLGEDKQFGCIVNTLNGLVATQPPLETWQREVKKCLHILNNIEAFLMGGERHEY